MWNQAKAYESHYTLAAAAAQLAHPHDTDGVTGWDDTRMHISKASTHTSVNHQHRPKYTAGVPCRMPHSPSADRDLLMA